MPINVNFDVPPTPPSSTDKTNFRLRYDAFLAYIQSLGAKLITFVTQINDLETSINNKEASATAAAASAAASANFKGTFIQGTSSALQGESYLWNTVIYRALVNTANSPTASPASWVATTYKECTLQTSIASAATTNIGTVAAGDTVHITGTNTITSFGTSTSVNGLLRIVVFDGALTLTHNATSLILPTGANIITAAGDTAEFVCENTSLGYWRCTGYQRKDGTALSATTATTQPATDNSTYIATTAHVHAAIKNDLNIAGSAPMYACRARVCFTTISSTSIKGSANVSSLTDNGTGDTTINFTVAMPDANYSPVFGETAINTTNPSYQITLHGSAANTGPTLKSTTQLRLISGSASTGGAADMNEVSCAIFG